MSKFLTNIFSNKSSSTSTPSRNLRPHVTLATASEDFLETDAAPVDDDNSRQYTQPPTPVSDSLPSNNSADIMAYGDPNYNSSSAVLETRNGSGNDEVLDATRNVNNEITTNNTMNVHNAQQQLVMQFSNVNQLHFGSVYNFNSNASNSTTKHACTNESIVNGAPAFVGETKRLTPRKTTNVVAMMQSQQEPNHRMLETIATHLGEGWKLVMRNLGHSEGQIEQAIIDHQMHGGIKEVIYQLLLQWVRNAEDGEATIARITILLWEMNHRECVQRMKLVYKSNATRKASS